MSYRKPEAKRPAVNHAMFKGSSDYFMGELKKQIMELLEAGVPWEHMKVSIAPSQFGHEGNIMGGAAVVWLSYEDEEEAR